MFRVCIIINLLVSQEPFRRYSSLPDGFSGDYPGLEVSLVDCPKTKTTVRIFKLHTAIYQAYQTEFTHQCSSPYMYYHCNCPLVFCTLADGCWLAYSFSCLSLCYCIVLLMLFSSQKSSFSWVVGPLGRKPLPLNAREVRLSKSAGLVGDACMPKIWPLIIAVSPFINLFLLHVVDIQPQPTVRFVIHSLFGSGGCRIFCGNPAFIHSYNILGSWEEVLAILQWFFGNSASSFRVSIVIFCSLYGWGRTCRLFCKDLPMRYLLASGSGRVLWSPHWLNAPSQSSP